MAQKILELSNVFLSTKELVLKLEGKMDFLSIQISSKNVSVAKQEGKQEQISLYQILFASALISTICTLILHYIFKV